MYWTKQHSHNAVAAKARLRIQRAEAVPTFDRRKVRVPRGRARFRFSIRDDKIGDSLTLSLAELPWRGRFVDAAGNETSTAKLCRLLREILNHE